MATFRSSGPVLVSVGGINLGIAEDWHIGVPMTEQEWLSSDDPGWMLAWARWPRGPFLGASTGDPRRPNVETSDRKLRLFACACYQLYKPSRPIENWDETGNPFGLSDLAWAKRWAEGTTEKELPRSLRAYILRCLFGNPFRDFSRYRQHDSSSAGRHYHRWVSHNNGLVHAIAEGIYRDRDFSPTALGELWDALEDAGCDNEDIRRHLAGRERCPCLRDSQSVGDPLHSCVLCNGTGWCLAATCPACWGKGSYYERTRLPEMTTICSTCHGTGRVAGEHVRGCWVIDLLTGRG